MKSAIVTALALILIGIASAIAKAESSRNSVTRWEVKSRMAPFGSPSFHLDLDRQDR